MKNLLPRVTTMAIVMVSSQHFYAMENSEDSQTKRFGTHEFSQKIGSIIMCLEELNNTTQSMQSQSDARATRRKLTDIKERQTILLQIVQLKLSEALAAALDYSNDHRAALEEITSLQQSEA